MEYYGNTLCVSYRDLVDGGIMSSGNLQKMSQRGRLSVVRSGKGVGRYALIAVDSLPEKYRTAVRKKYPDGAAVKLKGWVMQHYEVDQDAVTFFHDPSQCGLELPESKVREYVVNASVLNTCIRLYTRAKEYRRLMGEKYDWGMMSDVIAILKDELGHSLPTSTLRFRKKVSLYKREGYACLISGKWGNQSARKVDFKTEKLIVSIACLPNHPYNTSVLEMYNMFVCGELDVWDYDTGELLNPDGFTDKDGEPMELSESTITNYLNKPKNRIIIEKKQRSFTTFMHEQVPHMHRHAPDFSLSKVSFDDRDLPRKLKDTKARPKVYYAYDVASGCVVGCAYNRSKNVDLVIDCFRDMFRLLDRHGWGCPAQVEVENHLMSQWKESFLKAGVLFPYVRFCAPENSQEKYAEPMNGAKKRSVEHKNHLGIGRFYAKDRHYRTESKKVFDERNDTYEDKQYYTWEQLIAEDRQDVWEWNHRPHPNQKRYKGMTRWDVLVARINPDLRPLDKRTLALWLGDKVETTIRRNSYCRVKYKDWWLSDVSVIERLEPNNWKVDAYCLTDERGEVTDVFIYQNGNYIDRLEYVGEYNTADCEQTDEDKRVFVAQRKKIARFNAWVKEHEVPSVGVQVTGGMEASPAEALPEVAEGTGATDDMSMAGIMGDTDLGEDYGRKAVNEF